MKKIYLDTSVISFLEAHDAPDKMEITRKWWNKGRLYSQIYISELTLREIQNCPEPKRSKLLKELSSINFGYIKINKAIKSLAEHYISQNIIPVKYKDDALHIAIATLSNCDIILSWNFKHMVKLKTIREVNNINRQLGYKTINIMAPSELIKKEGSD